MAVMGFNNLKKFLFVMFFLISGMFMATAKSKNESYIIFWDYHSNLSIEYLRNASLSECLVKYPYFLKLEMSDFSKYDINSNSFQLKKGTVTDRMELFDSQVRNSKNGLLFFSVVLDGKIVLNGLNRISSYFLSQFACFEIDETDCLIIFPSDEKTLRIADRYYLNADYKNNCLDEKTGREILRQIH